MLLHWVFTFCHFQSIPYKIMQYWCNFYFDGIANWIKSFDTINLKNIWSSFMCQLGWFLLAWSYVVICIITITMSLRSILLLVYCMFMCALQIYIYKQYSNQRYKWCWCSYITNVYVLLEYFVILCLLKHWHWNISLRAAYFQGC